MWKRKIYDSIFDFLLVTMSVKTPKTQRREKESERERARERERERERGRERELRGWLRVSTTKLKEIYHFGFNNHELRVADSGMLSKE